MRRSAAGASSSPARWPPAAAEAPAVTAGPKRFPVPLARIRGDVRGEDRGEVRGDVRRQRPQRAAQTAVADALRRRMPAGLGLDSAAVRARMVARLREAGIDDDRVLAAFAAVERHRFVDSALANQAYEDTSLPIGFGQTISKPSVVGRMLQALLAGPAGEGDAAGAAGRRWQRVLEIGTGCGYQAALLARLAVNVVSIERVGALADKARANLAAAGVHNVQVRHGDGRAGVPALAPFDAIVSAAGGDDLPEAWLLQLATGGRLVAPGTEVRPGVQELLLVERGPGGCTRRSAGEVWFVPLKSGAE
ncbi:MAG: protein-L-isoaspartate(D-aspartate) O-methyltransferase [Rubrivivax sp.]|nr:protein-L-isoaspartate(D-aspartate) O-methyltransferase [Rubrivivax sp.]